MGMLYIGTIACLASVFVVLFKFYRQRCPACKSALMQKMKIDTHRTIKHCPRCCYSDWD